jgi:hypothetical protein
MTAKAASNRDIASLSVLQGARTVLGSAHSRLRSMMKDLSPERSIPAHRKKS